MACRSSPRRGEIPKYHSDLRNQARLVWRVSFMRIYGLLGPLAIAAIAFAPTLAQAHCYDVTFGQILLGALSPIPSQQQTFVQCYACGGQEPPPAVAPLPTIMDMTPPAPVVSALPTFEVVAAPPPELDNVVASAAAAVPEPSTWALLLLGFAGLGYASYRAPRKTSRWAIA